MHAPVHVGEAQLIELLVVGRATTGDAGIGVALSVRRGRHRPALPAWDVPIAVARHSKTSQSACGAPSNSVAGHETARRGRGRAINANGPLVAG